MTGELALDLWIRRTLRADQSSTTSRCQRRGLAGKSRLRTVTITSTDSEKICRKVRFGSWSGCTLMETSSGAVSLAQIRKKNRVTHAYLYSSQMSVQASPICRVSNGARVMNKKMKRLRVCPKTCLNI